MTTLRVIAEQLVAPSPTGIGRYAQELTRELITTAPAGCDVEAIVAAHRSDELADLRRRLDGVGRVTSAPIGPKELAKAWQYGVKVSVGGGMIHAPGLLAPLFKNDGVDDGEQIVVTVHDAVPWLSNHADLKSKSDGWRRAMVKRALKHADAVVVPTHAVAAQLAEAVDFGDRIRVIGGAVSPSLRVPSDEDARARDLKLPAQYILAVGSLRPRKALASLIAAMNLPDAAGLPLVVVGPQEWHGRRVSTVAMEAGLAEDRVQVLGHLDDADLAVVFDRATAFVFPSLAEGFGLPMLEAFQFGTPVIHSDDPALIEVAGGAGVVVQRGESGSSYPERLAAAIASVVSDTGLVSRLDVYGRDRARAFSWRDSAERVWQLHADL